jgi:ESCRT-I complex subunit TSG101
MYNIPVDVWIPNTYPLEPPIVYVTPAADMVVRSGQHVTLEGRVYHHYLAHWAEAWDVSAHLVVMICMEELLMQSILASVDCRPFRRSTGNIC